MDSDQDLDQDLDQLRLAGKDRDRVLGELLDRYRPRLRRMVRLRMDPRVCSRLDASDVLQEAFLEVAKRLDGYLSSPDLPFGLWVRFITGQQLLLHHRHHLGAQKRDAGRNVSLDAGAVPESSSIAVADMLIAEGTTPASAVARDELHQQLVETLEDLPALDREVLVLRHFEQLGNSQVARVLGIQESTASRRHLRALDRLAKLLGPPPDQAE